MPTLCAYTVAVLTKKGVRKEVIGSLSVWAAVPWWCVCGEQAAWAVVCAQSLSPGCTPYSSFSVVWFCDCQWRNPVLCSLGKNQLENFVLKHRLQILQNLFNVYTKGHALQVHVVGAQRVRSGGPGTVHVAKGTQWDNTGFNWKHISHGSHCRCCQVCSCYCNIFSGVLFSNLILSPCCLTVNC